MLKDPGPTQHELEMVTLEELMPSYHLLRLIDAIIDFSFIRDEVRHLYCDDNGRPTLDPVVLFKALFVGHGGDLPGSEEPGTVWGDRLSSRP